MMFGASQQENLWQTTAKDRPKFEQLDGDKSVDLVIVGGGFTGCAAALRASELGLSVALLEANTIGHGGSGRNVGLVNAGLWTPPQEVEDLLGNTAGQRLNQALAGAPKLVFELINTHEIDCDAVNQGTLHCAHAPSGIKDLEMRFAQLNARGAPVELLDATAAQKRTGSNKFFGALFDPRAGTIQPLQYVQGLAKAAQKAGAALFEQTPAQKVSYENGKWRVQTQKGTITAQKLLWATNAYGQAPHAAQKPQYTAVYYFQFATEPLTEKERASILPQREGCWDTALVMSSFRFDRDNRLLVGSIGSLDHLGGKTHEMWAKEKLKSIYPELAHKALKMGWCGRIAMTKDHLPKIVTLGENAYSVFGYSGRGIGPGTLFGTMMAEFLANGNSDTLPLLPIDSYQEGFTQLASLYYETGAVATHLSKASAMKFGLA